MKKEVDRLLQSPLALRILIEHMQQVLRVEHKALDALCEQLPPSTGTLLSLILSTSGKVVFTGMGKSGLIGRKLAATFASVGISSFFVHPGEALHGDLGMLQPSDLCIVLSKSGFGSEVAMMLKTLKIYAVKSALIACRQGSLAKLVDCVVILPFDREACSYNLVPTCSALITLAFGHALALAVGKKNGFSAYAFARVHPAGAIGKNLLLTVQDCMVTGDVLPYVTPGASFKDLILVMISGRKGVAIVCDAQRRLYGIVTDGDLRRAYQNEEALLDKTVDRIMTKNPRVTYGDVKAQDALAVMSVHKITNLVVLKDDRVDGVIRMQDLLNAGISLEKKV